MDDQLVDPKVPYTIIYSLGYASIYLGIQKHNTHRVCVMAAPPRFEFNKIILKGHFEEPLPPECPRALRPRGIAWHANIPCTGIVFDIFAHSNTCIVNVPGSADIEKAIMSVHRTMTSLGLPALSDLHMINMITHYNSGITNPSFTEDTEFHSDSKTRHEDLMNRLNRDLVSAQAHVARLHSNANPGRRVRFADLYAHKLHTANDKVRRCQERIDKEMKQWERMRARCVFNTRSVVLTHGKCVVCANGRWIFSGQACMKEVELDLEQLKDLVTPLPPIEDLVI